MPRSRDPRGRGRGGGYGGSRSAVHAFVPFEGTGQSGLHDTLKPEAWNTQRHLSASGGDQKLRHAKVNFVSAGGFEPSKLLASLLEPEEALADMSLHDGLEDKGVQNRIIRGPHIAQERFCQNLEDAAVKVQPEAEPEPVFIIDTSGSQSVATGFPPPSIRSSSPTLSDSSEEVIVFAGRDQARKGISRITQSKAGNIQDSVESKIKVIEDKNQTQKKLLAETVIDRSDGSHAGQGNTVIEVAGKHSLAGRKKIVQTPPSVQANLPISISTLRHRNKTGTAHNKAVESDEQAFFEDYIKNMDPDELDQTKYYNQRDLGGTDNDIWRGTDISARRSPPKNVKDNECGREKLYDFDDLSTSDGMVGSILTTPSKRLRKSCPQHLVVYDGEGIEGERWIATSNLTESTIVKLIEKLESKEKILSAVLDDAEGDIDGSEYESDADANVEISEEDDDLNETGLKQRKIDRMTDEKIAKLLSKQERFDMGSSELILFDSSSEDGAEDMIYRDIPQRSRSRRRSMQGARTLRGEFPDATALADAYDGFDIMDFERPSLKKKLKGRKGKLAFEISDSEFEASTQMALNNDRHKKKERREEREKLRALGLLGKKHSKPDLRAKFREGMGIRAVKDEMRNFLKCNDSTLHLPPMDKGDRMVVHEIANAFNLKSKSAGKGNKRFPILYRTSRTSTYNEQVFDNVEARLTRRFLPRIDLNGRGSGGISRKSGQGGFSNAAVSYRDGDIVGGSAPELGVENKGRAMLEKMGWSSGTALGALNNKGILQPVSHVVKTTKTGLG